MAKSVLRVLTDISEVKSTSEDNISRSFIDMEVRPNRPNLQDIDSIRHMSQLLNKKNQLHPLVGENHPYRAASQYGPRLLNSSRGKVSDFTQRIMSAKLLRVKELRNQVNLMQHQINELSNENRLLKTLQKRQETALHKYEGTEAKLPQLIQSHNEEVRTLQSKCKQMRINSQKLNEKLKLKESQLQNLQEQHTHLLELTRDQNLGTREELAQKVTDLERTVKEQSDVIQLLTRKVDLERKNYKHELTAEINKRKSVEQKLSMAMSSISALREQVETKEKFINSSVPSRYVRSSHSHSHVMNTAPRTRTQTQLPPSVLNNIHASTTNTTTHTIQTSNDQTGDEEELTSDTVNDHVTDGTSKHRKPIHMPKINQSKVNKISRSNYKLANIQNQVKLKPVINDESPEDYSSFFTSTDDSSKEVSKTSAVNSEKISGIKKEFLLKSYHTRRSSDDSQATHRSEKSVTSNETSDTTRNSNSSAKNRRNSMPLIQDPLENMDQFKEFLMQTNIENRIVGQKSLRDELQELEEQLMRGTNLFGSNKKVGQVKHKNNNELTEILISHPSESGTSKAEYDSLNSMLWTNTKTSEKKTEVQQYSEEGEEVEATMDHDYVSPYSTLNQDQKFKLLKALEDIDREVHGVGSSEEFEDGRQSSHISRNINTNLDYNFSQTDESLYKEKQHAGDRFRLQEKVQIEETHNVKDSDIVNKKSKDDFMKELFGSFENLKIESYNTQFSAEVNK